MLHIIPTQTTLELTNHHLSKKEKCAKLAQLQTPLLLVKIADPFQHCHLFFLFLRPLQLDFKLTLQTHQDRAIVKGQKRSGESLKCSFFRLVPYGLEPLVSTCDATIRDSIFLLQETHYQLSLCFLLDTLMLFTGNIQICLKSERVKKTHHLLLQSIKLGVWPIITNPKKFGQLIHIVKSRMYWFGI